jgi:hypothetical protein
MALNNLRSEVIELRNEGLEKDKILKSLLSKIKEGEAASKAQAEAQKCEIENLQKQLAEAKLKCAIAEADRDASDYWKNHWEKTTADDGPQRGHHCRPHVQTRVRMRRGVCGVRRGPRRVRGPHRRPGKPLQRGARREASCRQLRASGDG